MAVAETGMAQLLAVLEELTDRVDNAETSRDELADQQKALEATTRGLDTGLKSVVEALEVLQQRLSEREKQTDWDAVRPWAAQADPKQWQDLVTWVDWLMKTYRLKSTPIKPCWAAHPGVVEEIAALWEAWLVARASMRRNPTAEVAYWHDRLLHPTMRNLAGHADYAACSATEHRMSQGMTFISTNRELIPKPAVPGEGQAPPPDDD